MILEIEEKKKSGHAAHVRTERKSLRNASVLIIDDDVDAALLVASVFWQLGCNTSFALDVDEARRRLTASLVDVVILDWMISEKVYADEVLLQSIHTIDKFARFRTRGGRPKTKIISYSSLTKPEIQIPESRYFEHLDHWKKPMNQRELIQKSQNLIHEILYARRSP